MTSKLYVNTTCHTTLTSYDIIVQWTSNQMIKTTFPTLPFSRSFFGSLVQGYIKYICSDQTVVQNKRNTNNDQIGLSDVVNKLFTCGLSHSKKKFTLYVFINIQLLLHHCTPGSQGSLWDWMG